MKTLLNSTIPAMTILLVLLSASCGGSSGNSNAQSTRTGTDTEDTERNVCVVEAGVPIDHDFCDSVVVDNFELFPIAISEDINGEVLIVGRRGDWPSDTNIPIGNTSAEETRALVEGKQWQCKPHVDDEFVDRMPDVTWTFNTDGTGGFLSTHVEDKDLTEDSQNITWSVELSEPGEVTIVQPGFPQRFWTPLLFAAFINNDRSKIASYIYAQGNVDMANFRGVCIATDLSD